MGDAGWGMRDAGWGMGRMERVAQERVSVTKLRKCGTHNATRRSGPWPDRTAVPWTAGAFVIRNPLPIRGIGFLPDHGSGLPHLQRDPLAANAPAQRQTEFYCRLMQALDGLQTGAKQVPLLLHQESSNHLHLQPDPDARMRSRRVRPLSPWVKRQKEKAGLPWQPRPLQGGSWEIGNGYVVSSGNPASFRARQARHARCMPDPPDTGGKLGNGYMR